MKSEYIHEVCNALHCHMNPGNCELCPFTKESKGCSITMARHTLAVINDLRAEIASLNETIRELRNKRSQDKTCMNCHYMKVRGSHLECMRATEKFGATIVFSPDNPIEDCPHYVSV